MILDFCKVTGRYVFGLDSVSFGFLRERFEVELFGLVEVDARLDTDFVAETLDLR